MRRLSLLRRPRSSLPGKDNGQRRQNLRVVWAILGSIGLMLFGAGLYAVTLSIHDDPAMYFYVHGNGGLPSPSAFPARNGFFCEQYPFMFAKCADVNLEEFDPQVPAFGQDQVFDVWLVRSDGEFGCQAIAINVGSKHYTTPEFGWLAPLDTATPWALMSGFLVTVLATFSFARRKAWVTVPVLILPIFLALTYVSSHPFLGGC